MSTRAPSTGMAFPHEILTPITGKPTNTTVKALQKQLYANARSAHSTRGGGTNGHLGVVMPAAAYLARAGQAFDPPVHPGNTPVHVPGATSAQITEANRQFQYEVDEHTRYFTVAECLKKQLLLAVPLTYLNILQDEELGFADVTCSTMLEYLRTEYATISQNDIEANRIRLTEKWNVDQPLEDLWLRIHDIQRYAIAAAEPIPDTVVVRLTLLVLEDTGVFSTATTTWRDKDEADMTLPNFKAHYEKANKERIRKLTAGNAGYHGANTVVTTPPDASTIHTAASTITVDPASNGIQTNNNVTMYYCWTHGLGTNRSHTSSSCEHKAEGHKEDATANNLMGGNDRIMRGGRPRTTPSVDE